MQTKIDIIRAKAEVTDQADLEYFRFTIKDSTSTSRDINTWGYTI